MFTDKEKRIKKVSSDEQILLLDLLKILFKHTDYKEKKHLDQKDIIEILKKDYGDDNLYEKRGTVKENLEKLIDYFRSDHSEQDKITYKARFRNVPNKKANEDNDEPKMKEVAVLYNFAYRHLFTHAELRLIIDSILFSKQIPSDQREQLIEKLESLASKYFNSRIDNIRTMTTSGPMNDNIFENIRVLDDAISNAKQVSFKYNHYTVDETNNLVLEPRKTGTGNERTYMINPYQMVATNGRYYVICNYDYFNNLSHYRLDRITDIKMLDSNRKSLSELEEGSGRINLSQYMAEHIYMFRGESVFVSLRIDKGAIGEFIDWFGTDRVEFSNQTEDEVTARVKVNREAMRKWALQYALHVTVLSPPDLVDDVKEDIALAMKNYE